MYGKLSLAGESYVCRTLDIVLLSGVTLRLAGKGRFIRSGGIKIKKAYVPSNFHENPG